MPYSQVSLRLQEHQGLQLVNVVSVVTENARQRRFAQLTQLLWGGKLEIITIRMESA